MIKASILIILAMTTTASFPPAELIVTEKDSKAMAVYHMGEYERHIKFYKRLQKSNMFQLDKEFHYNIKGHKYSSEVCNLPPYSEKRKADAHFNYLLTAREYATGAGYDMNELLNLIDDELNAACAASQLKTSSEKE